MTPAGQPRRGRLEVVPVRGSHRRVLAGSHNGRSQVTRPGSATRWAGAVCCVPPREPAKRLLRSGGRAEARDRLPFEFSGHLREDIARRLVLVREFHGAVEFDDGR